MRRHGLVSAVGAVALALAGLAACSDDESSLSEEEFLEQGNEICREGSERTGAIGEELGDSPTDEEIEQALDETFDDVEGQIGDIRDLEEPEEMSDDVEAALDQALEDLDAAREAGADLLTAEEDPFAETNRLLTAVGLTQCAEG
jgi:phosphoglycolate phosphatase-like HAD superfamily hydrolase